MQKAVVLYFKGIRLIKGKVFVPIDWALSYAVFYTNRVQFSSFKNFGWPKVHVGLGGICILGPGFRSNNREMANPIGRFRKCSIVVGKQGKLIIGENVGMSSTAIVCHDTITIGNNVNIGGNVVIYDTDFHSLAALDRVNSTADKMNTKTKAVIIENNVFIGAHSTILKGVTIGENAIVGACSVVTKNIPSNEIWAGNPIRFIKKIVNGDS